MLGKTQWISTAQITNCPVGRSTAQRTQSSTVAPQYRRQRQLANQRRRKMLSGAGRHLPVHPSHLVHWFHHFTQIGQTIHSTLCLQVKTDDVYSLSYSAWAVLTKYHRQGDLHNRNAFHTVLEDRKSTFKGLARYFILQPFLLACRQSSSQYVLT